MSADSPSALVRPRFPHVAPAAAHYESVYLKAAAPGGGRAVWLRHTVLKPPGRPASGAVWLTAFDVGRPGPRALRAGGPVHVPAGAWIEAAGCRIGAGFATGGLTAGDRTARWDLRFEGDEPPARHLPAARLYEAPLPRTKALSPLPVARFAGTLALDDVALDLSGWSGMVGHNWGSDHAERWIWLQGIADRVWLDVAIARVRLGPVLLPWLATGHVCIDGRRHRVRPGPRPVVDATPAGARLRLRAGGAVVDADVRVPPGSAVAWRYASPGGGDRRTVNCSVADLDLRTDALRVRIAGAAAYELGGDGEDGDVPLAAAEPA